MVVVDRQFDENYKKLFFKQVREGNVDVIYDTLEKDGWSVETHDDNMDNALIIAAYCGHLDMVEMLVKFMKDKNKEDAINNANQLGITPVLAACSSTSSNSVKILHYLLKNGAIISVTDLGNSCFGLACAYGNLEVIKYLLQCGYEHSMQSGALCPHPLMLAMLNDQDEVLQYFYLPSIKNYFPQKLVKCSPEVSTAVNSIINNEAIQKIPPMDIDAPCSQYHDLNILTLAAVIHNHEWFNFLIEYGADIDYRLPSSRSVLEVCESRDFNPLETKCTCKPLKSKKTKNLAKMFGRLFKTSGTL